MGEFQILDLDAQDDGTVYLVGKGSAGASVLTRATGFEHRMYLTAPKDAAPEFPSELSCADDNVRPP